MFDFATVNRTGLSGREFLQDPITLLGQPPTQLPGIFYMRQNSVSPAMCLDHWCCRSWSTDCIWPRIQKGPTIDDPYFGYNELVILLVCPVMPDTDCMGSIDLHTVEKEYQLPSFSIIRILCFFPSKWSVSFCFPVWAVIDQLKFDFPHVRDWLFHPYVVTVTKALFLFSFLWTLFP